MIAPRARISRPAADRIDLRLALTDPTAVEYLLEVDDGPERDQRAAEALRVGVVALRSASPTLDMTGVQKCFGRMEEAFAERIAKFDRRLADCVREHFDERTGTVRRALDGFAGENGDLHRRLRDYFDPEVGHFGRSLRSQLGPGSEFAKCVDPDSKDGLLAALQKRVGAECEAKLEDLAKEFDLGDEAAAFGRLRKMLNEFFGDVREAVGLIRGAAEEAERGTRKGRVFEEQLYEAFATIGGGLDDETEFVGNQADPTGRTRKKRGDFLITLGDASAAPGEKIVVEVKRSASTRLRDAEQELAEAKQIYEASVGLFVFAAGTEPPELDCGLLRRGGDYYCVVSAEAVEAGNPLPLFDAAVKLCRCLAAATRRDAECQELDATAVLNEIVRIEEVAGRFVKLRKKGDSIVRDGGEVKKLADQICGELEERVKSLKRLLPA